MSPLKGLAQALAAVRVEWEPGVPRPALLSGVGRIFVGRDGELNA